MLLLFLDGALVTDVDAIQELPDVLLLHVAFLWNSQTEQLMVRTEIVIIIVRSKEWTTHHAVSTTIVIVTKLFHQKYIYSTSIVSSTAKQIMSPNKGKCYRYSRIPL